MIQSTARVALGLLFLATIVIGLWRHGKPIERHQYHAATAIGGVLLETVLIWLAGGWGG